MTKSTFTATTLWPTARCAASLCWQTKLNTIPVLMCFVCLAAWADCGQVLGDDSVGMGDIRGVIRPVRQATISTDAALRAIALPFREGSRFRRGDTLAEFDCRRQKADMDAATAVRREAILTLESNLQLDRYQAVGKNEVEITRARADKAAADMAGLETRLDECRLVAPFDGRIMELSLRVWERTAPQKPYISIIDDSAIEIELIAPSSMLTRLKPGTAFSFRLDDLGGRTVTAQVESLGAGIDPVSKTIKVLGIIKTQDPMILSGMSGTAAFSYEGKQ